MAGWSDRVVLDDGEDGRAYRPGEILVRPTPEQFDLVGELLRVPFPERSKDGTFVESTEDSESPPGEPRWSPSTQGYYKLSNYGDDLSAAIALLKDNEVTAQHNHVFFADSMYADPAHGNPAHGNPAHGNPAHGNPAHGNPAHGNPAHGNPYGPGWCSSGGCCCEADPCLTARRQGLISLVYPSPAMAPYYLPERAARRYRSSGVRASTAIPLDPPGVELPDNGEWKEGNVRVAVIDTGWPTATTDAELGNGFNKAFVKDAAPEDGDIPDSEPNRRLDPVSGHGMFIAGIILRYAPGVAVKVVKALTTYGDGDEEEIANRIDELVKVNPKPDIINLSLGTYAPEEPDVLARSVRNAIAEDVVVVASAGNDGTSRKQYPAAYPNVVSVGALGRSGPAPFSNWGGWVRASAPGVDIASGFWTFENETVWSLDPDRYENWALWSGTSFAAPIVAAALVRAMAHDGCDANEAVKRTIDNPCLARLPCYGTIVNPPCDLDLS